MLVDSHCHIDQIKLQDEETIDDIINRAKNSGVSHMLCVCIDMNNFQAVKNIAAEYEFISASVGVHPNEQDSEEPSLEDLIQYAEDPNIVAIGETGLDFYWHKQDHDWQIPRLKKHIQAARSVNKPLIIHTRDAREETIDILKKEDAKSVGGVLHCFTETWEMAQQAIELGFYISFSGIVTFKNAKQLQDVAKKVPLERLLIETDSPYLAPMPHRGKQNEPAFVRHVAEFVAELREDSFENIAKASTENYFNLFKNACGKI